MSEIAERVKDYFTSSKTSIFTGRERRWASWRSRPWSATPSIRTRSGVRISRSMGFPAERSGQAGW